MPGTIARVELALGEQDVADTGEVFRPLEAERVGDVGPGWPFGASVRLETGSRQLPPAARARRSRLSRARTA